MILSALLIGFCSRASVVVAGLCLKGFLLALLDSGFEADLSFLAAREKDIFGGAEGLSSADSGFEGGADVVAV